jgi:WD40 repeat protein
MPEVEEVFRMATQKIRPEPGALERQFQGQRRRSAQRKAGAVGLAAALAITAAVVAIQASRDTGGGGGAVPAHQGSEAPVITVSGNGLGFSADGSLLFTRGTDPEGVVYDAITGQTLQTVEGERGVGTVGFSPDGELFVTARGCGKCDQKSTDKALHTYVNDTATGEQLWDFHKACCFVAFSPDGRLLALPFAGHTRVVDLETGEPVNEFDAFGNFTFSPDGRQLIVGSAEKGTVAHVFDVGPLSSEEPVVTVRGDTTGDAFVTYVAWSPDGSTLVTTMNDREAVVWDASTGERRFAIPSPSGRITSVAFGSDPDRVATGSSDGTAIVWELSGDGALPIFTEHVDMGDQHWLGVALSPDGTRLMASTGTQTTVWNVS